jgi:cytoskeletal protein RodZ
MPDNVSAGVLLLVVVGVVGLGGIWAVDATVDDVGNTTTLTDTVNQTETYQPVGERGLDRYAEPVSVANSSGTVNASEWSWNQSEGTIAFDETRYVSQNQTENVTVSGVTASELPDESGAFVNIASQLVLIPGWMALLVSVGLVVFGLRTLNNQRGRGGTFP